MAHYQKDCTKWETLLSVQQGHPVSPAVNSLKPWLELGCGARRAGPGLHELRVALAPRALARAAVPGPFEEGSFFGVV